MENETEKTDKFNPLRETVSMPNIMNMQDHLPNGKISNLRNTCLQLLKDNMDSTENAKA